MKRRIRLFPAAVLFVIVSCAVITVNIYFPEKAVEEAYKNLEKELMTPEKGVPGKKNEEGSPAGRPESRIRFDFVPSAFAQEPGLADKISELVKQMPDVVNAYREMGARIAETDRLRDSGKVGEENDGLLVVREGQLSPAERKIVNAENENRKTVMRGMAKAIIRINRLRENEANIRQVLPQATEEFAKIRRESAKKGWWVQDPDGNWRRK
ncbi:MAG: DUF1318 domain-containing protein [Candidatus Sulfobium sp.]|jgi:uncharacterized protein YdbL (DUF1318 family)